MELETHDLQRSEAKGIVLPVGLWECMAKAYFADVRGGAYNPGSSGGETISVTEGVFWKVARAYYGDGFSLKQETGDNVADAGGIDSETATEVKRYTPVQGPTAIPRGNLARIAAANGLQSETDERAKSPSGDDSDSHKS